MWIRWSVTNYVPLGPAVGLQYIYPLSQWAHGCILAVSSPAGSLNPECSGQRTLKENGTGELTQTLVAHKRNKTHANWRLHEILNPNTLKHTQSRIMSVAVCGWHFKPLQRESLPADGLSVWPSGVPLSVPSSSTSQSRKNSSLPPEWLLIFMSWCFANVLIYCDEHCRHAGLFTMFSPIIQQQDKRN